MKLNYNKIAGLPHVIRSFCYGYDGWIVGSAASWLLDLKPDQPRDFDILCPFYTWGQACRTIPEGSVTNAFGGIKFAVEGVTIDIWAGDIGWFLNQVPELPAYAVHPKGMSFLTVSRDTKRIKSL